MTPAKTLSQIPLFPRARRSGWRWLLPVLLVLLFLSILIWLPWQAQRMEVNDRQEQMIADTLWVEQAIRFQMARDEESIDLISNDIESGKLDPRGFRNRAEALLRNNHELFRIVWLGPDDRQVASTDSTPISLAALSARSRLAAAHTRETHSPAYAHPAPAVGDAGPMALDYHVPMYDDGRFIGSLVATYWMSTILDDMVPWWFAQDNEIAFTDTDEKVVARRASGGPGHGVYTYQRDLDLPGATLTLRTNSVKSAPNMLPNLLVGSVILLSLGLVWSLWALWRDIERRLTAEGALRQQVSFRTAMENSLVTGLRARDLDGRITYVNPAFCEMVGIPAEELVGKVPPMPYWAPEAMDEYQERFSQVLAGAATPQFETVFQRRDGERFPVLVFESPLVDDSGRQTGWMGSILDISDRKRIENLSRVQQEKLQGSARLASMGEIASTLAHELNQPLAAISSYTTGAINLMERGGIDPALLKPALEKANMQAQRAGQIIRSVHEFVKKREPAREPVDIPAVIDSIVPLMELQARQWFVVIHTSYAPRLPAVSADRVMLEQVLLNLTRNAIEAMQHVAPERRILRIAVRPEEKQAGQQNVEVQVIDQGHGIPTEVAERLFSPFFSTKAEGMGMGLNICRTAIELHGGTLSHLRNPTGGT
ncbi:MAG: PAS domain S-box protein, partial [Burkholderiaceae bacterium]